MLRVGLTGSIGSGKSTISRIFSALNIPVYMADLASKRILSLPEVSSCVMSEFPNLVFDRSNFASFTKALGHLVFNDPTSLKRLNNILHPLIFKDLSAWFNQKEQEGYPYAIVEAAILFESGMQEFLNYVIDIETSRNLQIERTCRRDNCSKEEVEKRLSAQLPPTERIRHSDFIIQNDEKEPLLSRILEIDSFLRKG